MSKLSDWQKAWGDKVPLISEKPKPKAIDFSKAKRVPDRWQPKWIRDKYYGGTEPSARSQQQIQKMYNDFGR